MIESKYEPYYNQFIELARKKSYKNEDIKMLGLLALTKNAIKLYGSIDKSFVRLIEITKKCETSKEAFDIIGTEIGI